METSEGRNLKSSASDCAAFAACRSIGARRRIFHSGMHAAACPTKGILPPIVAWRQRIFSHIATAEVDRRAKSNAVATGGAKASQLRISRYRSYGHTDADRKRHRHLRQMYNEAATGYRPITR